MRGDHETRWHHHNRYSAESACKHCEGIIRHAAWCKKENAAVAYAFKAASSAADLSVEDQELLRGLGVSWNSGKF